jgi:hypothetical protein
MHLERMIDRLSRVHVVETATLVEYALAFNKRGRDGSGKCNVVPHAGRRVPGVVYRLDTRALSRLDRIEGGGYRRIPVVVSAMRSRRRYRASCYVAKAIAIDDSRIAYDWYRDIVADGAAALGLSRGYIEWLRAVPARPDPNRRRYRQNAGLLPREHARVGATGLKIR